MAIDNRRGTSAAVYCSSFEHLNGRRGDRSHRIESLEVEPLPVAALGTEPFV
jgi:hypothetical protein